MRLATHTSPCPAALPSQAALQQPLSVPLPWPLQIILAVSFTKRASQELKTRLDSVLGFVDSGVTLGTFHSVALYLLRMHAASFAELTPQDTNPDAAGRFLVLDEDDSRVSGVGGWQGATKAVSMA